MITRSTESRIWSERTPRERSMIVAGGTALLSLLLWFVFIEPALEGRARWNKDLPMLRADYAQMQSLARQLSHAPASTLPTPPADRASIERSLNDAGLTPQSLNVSDDDVRVRFTDVSFTALIDWLQRAQRDSRLLVSEASVTARERVDRVDASLSLRPLR